MLVPFAKNIWTADGPPVNFNGFEYSVRMTIIQLRAGELFVHSPIYPVPEMLEQVNQLGDVKYIVSPNKIHHLYMGDWQKRYPTAKMFASPGLKRRRADLVFDGELVDYPPEDWAKEIDQLIFGGSLVMSEVVFFHHKSKTLILADLIENFERDWFKGWKNWIARKAGIVAPDGQAPLDFRLSFLGGKSKAKTSLERIKAWQPRHIIIAHGSCYKDNAMEEINRAFRWVG
ncbi:MAG: DUF4336 domain-containing protein [Rhizobiaceae bacterium]|nr:DUF4336 domain-containing protein [Rhizobiaceae bacterium]